MKSMRASVDDLIPTRQSLLSRLREWDNHESWREFFDTYWSLIYGLAVKCGLSDAEAQDVVQETLIAVARQMPGFRYDPAAGSFKGWLLTITRRRIADEFRKREKAAALSGSPCSDAAPGHSADGGTDAVERIPDPAGARLEEIWEQEWRGHLLRTALERVKRRVSPKQFQMFDLQVIQQWPMKLITSTLGVNRAQVYMAKLRVGRLVREEMRREGRTG